MFYSQFILAKKGPLGTIWIAAHLERKLRKNQVADTDIGVSVDSILFPDVPIALRLSSHLLLGVVRIYSRKVNYLFHDCSEALLKIKQAFRSTAVDLPPEESTAPYHSITLPETFDLDDFELPDSAFLQGNFVDHHVSTREQITLQDSVDGTGYSASQFGLDERFGDGDASQIRLDLDEDLFLDKNPSPQHVSASLGTNLGEVHQGQPSISLTDMDIDEGQNGCDDHKIPETPKDLSDLLSNDCGKYVLSSMDYLKRNNGSSHRHGYNIQTPDLNEVFFPDDHPSAVPDYAAFAGDDAPSPDLFECAHAPSTPGLMEEAIPASVHEIPALSPQEKTSSPDTLEVINKDSSISPCIEFEASDVTNNIDPINDASMDPQSVENAQVVRSPTSVLTEPKSMNIASESSGGILTAPDESHLECGHKNEDNLHSACINSEVNNLQIAHDNTEAIRPEVTCLDVSSCSHEASNSETPLNRFTADNVHLDLIHTDVRLTSICSHEASNLETPLSKPTTYNVHPDVTCVDGLLTSSCSHELSDLATPLNKPTADDVIIVTSNDKVQIQGMASEINDTSPGNKAVPSILVNQDHEKDVDSCLSSNTSALISELYLKSCSSQLNQANVLSSEDAMLVGNAPEFSHRELTSILEEPLGEVALHVSGFSVEVQGKDNCIANVTDTDQELHRKEDRVSLEFKSGVNKPDAQSTGLISKDIQLDNMHISSNIHYPEPEKMLFASTNYVNPPHDLGQFTADKGVTESARGVDRIDGFSGKKRCLMDSTPVLEIGNSAKMSGLPRVRRNNVYIADDDDLLASILVGRTPNVRMGPTPPPSKVTSRKRPRLAHKAGMSKRKVLLDDTMVLHADAIRQQLMNTEDIRRIRKKAPCTRPEIWKIHKSSMEEELFSESLFTGISTELSSLFTRSYDVNKNLGPQIGEHHSDEYDFHVELLKEVEHSRSVEFVQDSSEKEIGELITVMPFKVGVMQGPSDTSVSIEEQNSMDAVKFDAQEKLESHPPQVESSDNNQTVTVSTVGINEHESVGTKMPMLSASNYEHAISPESTIEKTFIHINSNTHSSSEKSGTRSIHQEQESPHELVQPSDKVVEMDDRTSIAGNASVEDVASYGDATGCNIVDNMASVDANDDILVRDEDTHIAKATSILGESNLVDNVHLNCPRDYHDVGKIENGEILVSMLDRCLLEDRDSLPIDSSTIIGRASSPTQVTTVENAETTEPAVTGHHSMEESKEDRLEVIPEGVEFVERVSVDEERHTSGIVHSENPQVISSCPHQPNSEIENVPSAVGENASLQEGNLGGGLEAENAPVDIAAARESNDFCDTIDDDDATEFLNVDDEADFDEEEDADLPNSEGGQLLENSGWSTRTRGVARYLKTLFDEDSGRGKKVVTVDHLLAGKTRKEASRMFFETLVLKTKDYIHVEQENPFECINIKPRPKILKSGF